MYDPSLSEDGPKTALRLILSAGQHLVDANKAGVYRSSEGHLAPKDRATASSYREGNNGSLLGKLRHSREIDTETTVSTATSGIHIVPERVQPVGRSTHWYRAIAGRLGSGYTRTHQRPSRTPTAVLVASTMFTCLHRLEVSVQRTHQD